MKRVAVTGLGCVTPIGNDAGAFWESLVAGRHGFAEITRFDPSGMKARIAAEVKGFDPTAYMPGGEVRKTDLYAQYAVAASVQAVEDSGFTGANDPERTGVYIGSGIGGMDTFLSQAETLKVKGPGRVSPFFIPMMISNMASAQVAIRYNAKGPCLPVVSACSTSTHAIGEAFRAIKHGYADVIIAGGAEAAINPLSVSGFANCLALSTSDDPDSCSIPFDKRRDGFVIGEGAGILVLEEYGRAAERGANIYCEICGYGNTNDAFHITSPHPGAEGAIKMMEQAVSESGILPDEKLYVNMHGTGTPPNDKTETIAIKAVFGELAYRMPLSSTKSMTGHMLGAAGGAEAVAAVMAIKTGIVPPTIGLREPDPECDLDYMPNKMRECGVNKAMSVSMGFGGHNAGVIFIKDGEV